MPLVRRVYMLADSNGRTTVEFTQWARLGAPDAAPLFVPSPSLNINLGGGPVSYSPSEYSQSEVSNPALLTLTVQIAKSLDTGGTLYTVLLPTGVPVEVAPPVKVEAVGIRTVNRTFLGNVGQQFAAETYAVSVLTGTLTEQNIGGS